MQRAWRNIPENLITSKFKQRKTKSWHRANIWSRLHRLLDVSHTWDSVLPLNTWKLLKTTPVCVLLSILLVMFGNVMKHGRSCLICYQKQQKVASTHWYTCHIWVAKGPIVNTGSKRFRSRLPADWQFYYLVSLSPIAIKILSNDVTRTLTVFLKPLFRN